MRIITFIAMGVLGALRIQGQNLLINADFEAGNTNFASDYLYAPGSMAVEGSYCVVTNAHSVHSLWASLGDHTTGSGLMLVVNAGPSATDSIWRQTVPVGTNTDYQFTVWVAESFATSPGCLAFLVNGVAQGATAVLPDGAVGAWQNYAINWNSGNTNAATLEIRDLNTEPNGNDFVLDDLCFRAEAILGQEAWWTNPISGGWGENTNWNPASAPTASTRAHIDNGGAASLTTPATIYSLILGTNLADAGTLLVQTGGVLNVHSYAAGIGLHVGLNGAGLIDQIGGVINCGEATGVQNLFSIGERAGSAGVYTLRGGGLTVYSGNGHDSNCGFVVGGGGSGTWNVWGGAAQLLSLWVGRGGSGVGVVNQTNGAVNVGVLFPQTVESRIGGANPGSTNAVGLYELSGGTLTNAGNYQVGAYGRGTNRVSGRGIVSVGGWPSVGRFAGGVGVLEVSSGSFCQEGTATSLIIGEQGTGFLNLSGNGFVSCKGGLNMGKSAGGKGTINLDGGVLQTPNIFRSGGTAALNFNGGILRFTKNITALTNLTSIYIKPGQAFIDTSNNTITITGTLLDSGGGVTKLGSGSLWLSAMNTYSGDTIVSNGFLGVNNSSAVPSGAGKGKLVVNSGATFGMNGYDVTLNALSGSGTVQNLTAARTLRLGGQGASFTFAGVIKGNSGYGGNPVMIKEGAGTMTLGGTQDNPEAVLLINQGTAVLAKSSSTSPDVHALGEGVAVYAGGMLVLGGTGGDQIWDGGVIYLDGGIADLNGRNEGIAGLWGTSGVVLNNATNAPSTLTLGTFDGSCEFGGKVQDGLSKVGITKIGAGAATLTGTNTYSGGTAIVAGSLIIDGALAGNGSVLVSSGARLGGAGFVDADLIASGMLRPGSADDLVAGTLTLSNLFATASGSLGFKLSGVTNVGTGINDLLVVRGLLNLNGNTVAISPTAPTLAVGRYRLVNYLGTKIGAMGPVSHNTRSSLWLDESAANQIDLVVGGVTNANLRWTGGSNSTWDVAATTNWLNLDSLMPDRFMMLDRVVFNDTAGGSTNVTLASVLYPASVTIAADTNHYTLSGPGKISGAASLLKTGASALTLSAANDFTGSLEIQAGLVQAADARALGAATSPVAIGNGATLDLNGYSFGAKPVSVQGAGVGSAGAIISSRVADNASPLIAVTLAGDTTFGGSARWDMRSDTIGAPALPQLHGNGHMLTKTGTNEIWLVDCGETSIGDICVQQGTLGFQGSTTMGDTNRSMQILPGGSLGFWSCSTVFGKSAFMTNAAMISNSGTNVFAGPLQLDGMNTVTCGASLELRGAISGSGGLIKAGSGTLILAHENSYLGGTLVSGGTLQVGSGGVGGSIGSGVVTNNGLLTLNRSDDFSLGSVMTGTNGSLIKVNTNTVVLTSSNFLLSASGGTFQANRGRFSLDPSARLTCSRGEFWVAQGAATGECVINGGTLIASNWIAAGRANAKAQGTLTLNSGIVAKRGANHVIIGSLGGTGTLTINGGYFSNNASVFLGESATGRGFLTMNGGWLQAARICRMEGYGGPGIEAVARFNGGLLQAIAGHADFIDLDQALVQAGGLILDDAGYALTNAQPLLGDSASPGGGLVKLGAGSLTLAGSNSYTGPTRIDSGSLCLIGNGSLPASSQILIAAQATLCVTGLNASPCVFPATQTLGGLGRVVGSAQVNGVLMPGSSNQPGTLTVEGDLVLAGLTTMRLQKTGAARTNDQVRCLSTLHCGGTLILSSVADPLVVGDAFRILDAGAYQGGFSTVIVPPLPYGIRWDTSRLTVDGVIAIVPLPVGWYNQDIGVVGVPGSAAFTNGNWRLSGAGSTMTGTSDAGHFVHRTWTGDGEIVARLADLQGGNSQAEAGVMFRESVDAGARAVYLSLNRQAANNQALRRRPAPNGMTFQTVAHNSLPGWLRLMRVADNFVGLTSTNGLNWEVVTFTTLHLPPTLDVGLAVCSHQDAEVATVDFDNVVVAESSPLPPSWNGGSFRLLCSDDRALLPPALFASDAFRFLVAGEPGQLAEVLRSGDLRNWSSVAGRTNTLGVFVHEDYSFPQGAARFFRAHVVTVGTNAPTGIPR